MSSIANPLCSVIIPAYNCEHFLEQSVLSASGQSYDNLEIIIIDDCSTDGTLSIAQTLADSDSRIVFLKNDENVGVANTRNKGFTLARGSFIALLDSDDIWLPEKIELQLKMMNKSNCDICYTSYSFIDSSGNAIKKPYLIPEKTDFSHLLTQNVIGCSTAMFKKEITDHFIMRPEYAHEDYVFWLELLKNNYTAAGIKEPLVNYRVLQNSRSGDKIKSAKNRWQIYRKFLGLSYISSLKAFSSYLLYGIEKHILS